jgi:hypothetical protein
MGDAIRPRCRPMGLTWEPISYVGGVYDRQRVTRDVLIGGGDCWGQVGLKPRF